MKANIPLSIVLTFLGFIAQGQNKTQTANVMSMGKTVYTKYCMPCHQIDGAGAQNMIPPLIKTSYVLGNKTVLVKIILFGLNGEITVNGDIYWSEMPPQSNLTDQEIAAVLTYVRKSFGNKASYVSPDEVRKVRSSN